MSGITDRLPSRCFPQAHNDRSTRIGNNQKNFHRWHECFEYLRRRDNFPQLEKPTDFALPTISATVRSWAESGLSRKFRNKKIVTSQADQSHKILWLLTLTGGLQDPDFKTKISEKRVYRSKKGLPRT